MSRSFISSSDISIEDSVFSVIEEKFCSVLSLENGVHCEAKYTLKISALSLHLVTVLATIIDTPKKSIFLLDKIISSVKFLSCRKTKSISMDWKRI